MADLRLRQVEASDIETFYRHQADPEAGAMASFAARDRDAHLAHWTKILGDTTVVARAVVIDDEVVGNVVSWRDAGRRLVGYWIGREHWGRGIATDALRRFTEEVAARPLYAKVAEANVGSIRVLEKCGFERSVDRRSDPGDIPEILMVLE